MSQLLRIATAGSVDDGKSTLIGRLLFDSKAIFEDQLSAVEHTSQSRGHEGPDLALLTDGLRAEREQGITIDVAYRYFATKKRKVIIADTPGHVQYTRNMATGASTADAAIVLVDARLGVLAQTRRHAFIAQLLGIRHLAVAINKVDLVDDAAAVVARVAADVRAFTARLGFRSVVVVQDAGRTVTDLQAPRDDFGLPVSPVAVTGTDCAGPEADCAVVVNRMESFDNGSAGGSTWLVRPGKRPAEVAGAITNVSAIAADGSTAGTVRIIEDGDGSCAGVAGPRGKVRWTSCRDRIVSFSPSSVSVLAGTSASFGSGDHELTVLDASTGEERLRLETAPNVGIFEAVWEDDEHLLAVVADWREDESTGEHTDHRWAVLRIGLDGTREYAVEPVPGDPDDYDGPLDLPQD